MIIVIRVCNTSTMRQVSKLINVFSGQTGAAGRSQALQVLAFLEITSLLHVHPSGYAAVLCSEGRARRVWEHLTAIKPLAVIVWLTYKYTT